MKLRHKKAEMKTRVVEIMQKYFIGNKLNDKQLKFVERKKKHLRKFNLNSTKIS